MGQSSWFFTQIEEITEEFKGHLRDIVDGVCEGALSGVKEGVAEGVKRGVKDGLKECLTKGFVNLEEDDIGDILDDIPEELIKNSVKEGAKSIFENSTRDYLQRLCQKLIERIRKGDIELPEDQTGLVLSLIKRSEQEAVKKIVDRLPNNFFFGEILAGVQGALEESLEINFKTCEERVRKEIEG